MPYLEIRVKDAPKSLAREFKEFAEYVYGGGAFVESESPNEAQIQINVPGDMAQAEFESDMAEWCEEHGCSYELVNQTPEAPSPQFFSKNMKLMYPRMKDYERLASDPKKLETAKKLFRKSWGAEFNPEDPDDREDIVILYNMYMDDLSEWKPVVLKLRLKPKM